MLYNFLIAVNSIFLIYVFAVFIAPRKTLFFIKDKIKRKRIPYSLIVLGCYIGWFAFMSPVIEKTPERKLERIEQADSLAMANWDNEEDGYGENLTAEEVEMSEYLKGTWVSEDEASTFTFKPLIRAIPYDFRPANAANMPHMLRITMKVKLEEARKTKPYYLSMQNEGGKHFRLFSTIANGKGDCNKSYTFYRKSMDTIALQDESASDDVIEFHRVSED